MLSPVGLIDQAVFELSLLSYNADIARQHPVVKGPVPLAIETQIGHALEADALDHEKFHQERRYFIMPGLRFGSVAANDIVEQTSLLTGC